MDTPRRAPTNSGLWPLRPSARATKEQADRYDGMLFKEGDPIGYCRDPEKWLPEFSLDALPLVKAPDVCYDVKDSGRRPNKLKTGKKKMSENSNTETTTTTEASAPQTPPKKVKKAKAPTAPKEPWTAPDSAEQAVAIMREFAEAGDKKVLAYFVTEAIACRQRGKEVRENLIDEEAPASDSDPSTSEGQ